MPRQPISTYWRQRVNALAAAGCTAAKIEQDIQKSAFVEGDPAPAAINRPDSCRLAKDVA